MSSSSRRFLMGVVGAIVLLFLAAGAVIVAYNAGRAAGKAAQEVVVSVEDGQVTIEPVAPAATAASPVVEATEALEAEETELTTRSSETATPAATAGPESAESETSAAEASGDEQAQDDPAEDDGPRIPVELEDEDVDLILEVWEIVDEEFDGRLPARDEVLHTAIRSTLELLGDENTRYIDPVMAERSRQRLNGSFEGIGAFVDLDEDGNLLIVRPIEGQPADRAGLQADDVVTHVEGKPVLGMTLEEIIAEVTGPEGTAVTLTIRRESVDEPFDVTIVRQRIEFPIVSGEMLAENIAYVRLATFGATATQQLEAEVEAMLALEPQALILDLRDNTGGFLAQSVQVADLFLGEGVILYERDGRELEEVFESADGDLAEDIPLVLLVNGGSASASEILAGAVQDRQRGILVGEQTFGKGSVQKPHVLSDGSELRVTIARWYTPNNQSIDPDGIRPDIEVESPEEFGTENDTQLQRAIRYILDGQ